MPCSAFSAKLVGLSVVGPAGPFILEGLPVVACVVLAVQRYIGVKKPGDAPCFRFGMGGDLGLLGEAGNSRWQQHLWHWGSSN